MTLEASLDDYNEDDTKARLVSLYNPDPNPSPNPNPNPNPIPNPNPNPNPNHGQAGAPVQRLRRRHLVESRGGQPEAEHHHPTRGPERG
eukprot:scaffold54964_cov36-Phaeocystis_antarctica.AAC.1